MQERFSLPPPIDPSPIEITVDAIVAHQPIGDVILATFTYQQIVKISHFDVRRLVDDERDVERYLGIQRPLIPSRVASLEKFVNFADATFPTAIIIAVDEQYASFDPKARKLTVRNFKLSEPGLPTISISNAARVIDGQHRIAGLMKFQPGEAKAAFDVPVTVFVGADIADQAYVFSTVNLEQTKVSKSLAVDLYELAKTRSPYKTCHNIAVALDRDPNGPLFRRIKRLGFATEGRLFEPITQATFVDSLLLYISSDPKTDRDLLLRGRQLPMAKDPDRQIFRSMFIDERDVEIARVVSEYFYAVRERWPQAWEARERGRMLNRTNGVRALMRALGHFYRAIGSRDQVPSRADFLRQLQAIELRDEQFNTEEFPPGTTGEAKLVKILEGRPLN